MNTEQITNRLLLRFTDEVKARFAFLEANNFRCTRSEATLVRFESAELAINIYHDRQSYEIGLEIANMRGGDSFSFSEILRLDSNEQAERYRNYASHTIKGVAEGVRQLAERFRKCVDTGTLNDGQLFSRLKAQRGEWAANYALETQLEQARRKSDSAWAERNFEKVIAILAPVENHLNSSELKRLEYAKKKIRASM